MTANDNAVRRDHARTGAATGSFRAIPSPRLRLGRRHLWLVPGLAIAVYANARL